MSGRHSQPRRPSVSSLPRYLVRLAPIQVVLVVVGIALIGGGVWATASFDRSVGKLSSDGIRVEAEVIDVVWSPRSLPTKLKIRYEYRGRTREATAWSHTVERLDSADASQVWHGGDRLQIYVDAEEGRTFAAPSGYTFSSNLVLGSEAFLAIGFGVLLIAASFSMSVVAWRNDGTTT